MGEQGTLEMGDGGLLRILLCPLSGVAGRLQMGDRDSNPLPRLHQGPYPGSRLGRGCPQDMPGLEELRQGWVESRGRASLLPPAVGARL